MSPNAKAGFTIVELTIVITLTVLVGAIFFQFASVSIGQYLRLQTDASANTTLAHQSQRVATVIRGATQIVSGSSNELVIYSYFYPSDTYVSLTRYYLSNSNTTLSVDVTPMTANPPVGSPITSKLKTFQVMDNYALPGSGMFSYLDASGTTLSLPLVDIHAVKSVRVTLAMKNTSKSIQTQTMQINLRNMKTNL